MRVSASFLRIPYVMAKRPDILQKLDHAKQRARNETPELQQLYAAYGILYLDVIDGNLDDAILRNLVKVTMAKS